VRCGIIRLRAFMPVSNQTMSSVAHGQVKLIVRLEQFRLDVIKQASRMNDCLPILFAERSKGRDCGLSLSGFKSRQGHKGRSLVSDVCCKVEVSATGRSLVQRSPINCGV
jgi:hypothetical protein